MSFVRYSARTSRGKKYDRTRPPRRHRGEEPRRGPRGISPPRAGAGLHGRGAVAGRPGGLPPHRGRSCRAPRVPPGRRSDRTVHRAPGRGTPSSRVRVRGHSQGDDPTPASRARARRRGATPGLEGTARGIRPPSGAAWRPPRTRRGTSDAAWEDSARLGRPPRRRLSEPPQCARAMSFGGAAISLGATVISLAFSALVFAQWLGRRRPYQLAWSLGLGLYAVAAFTQFLAEAYGWSVTVYKVYYLFAAPLVAVLGIGSVFLIHRRAGIGFALYTAIIFAGFAAAVAGATVNTDALASAIPVAGTARPANVRMFSPLFTVPGSVALVGVAAHSYWRSRLSFNLWIGIGALIVAAGGSFARFNISFAPYGRELFWVSLI